MIKGFLFFDAYASQKKTKKTKKKKTHKNMNMCFLLNIRRYYISNRFFCFVFYFLLNPILYKLSMFVLIYIVIWRLQL